jgi:hypothetical protein
LWPLGRCPVCKTAAAGASWRGWQTARTRHRGRATATESTTTISPTNVFATATNPDSTTSAADACATTNPSRNTAAAAAASQNVTRQPEANCRKTDREQKKLLHSSTLIFVNDVFESGSE